MINIYLGPSIGLVADRHQTDPEAQVIREHFLDSWRAGGLTGVVLQVADWSTIGMVLSEIHRSDGELVHVRDRAEFENRPPGSFGVFVSVEGYGDVSGNGPFTGDPESLYTLAELGVTTFTFSHNVQNLLCTGCNERFGEGGFTHLGKATLKRLETLPVMVDLVHMSRASFWDALSLYDGDVFVSHANSDAVCPHQRNLTDEQIRAVAERGGVVGVTTYRGYVTEDPYRATLSDLLDHAMHIYDLVGPEHLAVGADFSGSPMELVAPALAVADPENAYGLNELGPDVYAVGPTGVEDASRLGAFLAGLAERGLSQREVELVAGGSYLAMLDRTRPADRGVPA